LDYFSFVNISFTSNIKVFYKRNFLLMCSIIW